MKENSALTHLLIPSRLNDTSKLVTQVIFTVKDLQQQENSNLTSQENELKRTSQGGISPDCKSRKQIATETPEKNQPELLS